MNGKRASHLKAPIPGFPKLLDAVQQALGPNRLPLLIGIDGRWGSGKSGTAAWLSWQLGVPFVALDLYMVQGSDPLEWRYEDLMRVLDSQERINCTVIVEGICLLKVLQMIARKPELLVWTENKGGPSCSPHEPTLEYIREFDPAGCADHRLVWDEGDLSASGMALQP